MGKENAELFGCFYNCKVKHLFLERICITTDNSFED